MYAVISDRGRQATVREGDVVLIDLDKTVSVGDVVTFDSVMLVSNEGETRIGKPLVEGARVTAEVLGESKGDKLVVFRFKRRKNVRVKRGHRQHYTRVRITGIEA